MKSSLLIFSCLLMIQIGGAQNHSATPPETNQEALPRTTIQFKPIGEALAISLEDMFVGYPFCSMGGTTYLSTRLQPDYTQEVLFGISPKGDLSKYEIDNLPGLVHATVMSVDANESNAVALVSAQKADALRDFGHDPSASDSAFRAKYYQYFLVRIEGNLSTPDEILLNLPFTPEKIAVIDRDRLVVLGDDPNNQVPVLAIIDQKGQLIRQIDTYDTVLNNSKSLMSGAPQQVQNQSQSYPGSARISFIVSSFQMVHYNDELLLLIPGSSSKVLILHPGGNLESIALKVPKGLEVQSLIASDTNWFVRISDGSGDGPTILEAVNPATGDPLRLIQTRRLSTSDITCVHDGQYLAVHAEDDKGVKRLFLMKGSE